MRDEPEGAAFGSLRRTGGRRRQVVKTQQTYVHVGEGQEPRPAVWPDFLRVDSMHQSDLCGEKGPYEINLVEEVTQ